jgi:hypothetical protein
MLPCQPPMAMESYAPEFLIPTHGKALLTFRVDLF